ncbi:uncharacterized protein LOC113005917 isoform X2 [Solenopsis invicta]|uniref:uncharacterized protein LOC113005917 isoform X2 n=1 Tax=Solenopsis invicta TaxID=13686 RepID=UPI00193E7A4D|nr:uncharacterized protein LOC113005917 isoform X2 [Solenopsis invicta]
MLLSYGATLMCKWNTCPLEIVFLFGTYAVLWFYNCCRKYPGLTKRRTVTVTSYFYKVTLPTLKISIECVKSHFRAIHTGAFFQEMRTTEETRQLLPGENIASVTSLIVSIAKDILLPFSKLAKDVQTLDANLDPKKLKTSDIMQNLLEHRMKEHCKLQERWASCQSKLVAL